jgi:hypothetical protein
VLGSTLRASSEYAACSTADGSEEDVATTFEKLNLKDQKRIVVVNAPASFERELAALRGVAIARDARDAAA